jgi:hypothetical protein
MMVIKLKKITSLAFFFFNWYDIPFGSPDYYNSKEE